MQSLIAVPESYPTRTSARLERLRKNRYASKIHMKPSLIRLHGILFNPSEPINEDLIDSEKSISTAVSCIVLIAAPASISYAADVKGAE